MISQWDYDREFKTLFRRDAQLYKRLDGANILLTGATGLLGTCVAEFFIYLRLVEGIDVAVTLLATSKHRLYDRFGKYLGSGDVSAIVQDIRRPLSEDQVFDYIIHAASVANPSSYMETPADVIDVTVLGTRNVLDCASRNGARFIYVSSVEVYGDISDISNAVDEDEFGSLNPLAVRCSYTESKRLAETMSLAYQVQHGVSTSIVRLSKTYGPSASSTDRRVMAFILNCLVCGKDIVLKSDGSRVFSFCYVTDAASAIISVLLKGAPGQAYNVADKDSVANLREIAEWSAKSAGVCVHVDPTPAEAISQDTVVDSSKLRSMGWSPLTHIRTGLKRQYQGLMAHRRYKALDQEVG